MGVWGKRNLTILVYIKSRFKIINITHLLYLKWNDHYFQISDNQNRFVTSVRGQDNTNPVERIRRVWAHNSKQRNLAADKENKQGDCGP